MILRRMTFCNSLAARSGKNTDIITLTIKRYYRRLNDAPTKSCSGDNIVILHRAADATREIGQKMTKRSIRKRY